MANIDRRGRPFEQHRPSQLSPLWHLIMYDVRHSMAGWRWWILLPVYGALGMLYAGMIRFDYVRQQPRNVNIWDVPPAIVSNPWINVWLVATGFVLLIGDGYVRDRDQNILALTLIRMPSRLIWWSAKLGAVGLLAVYYVTVVFGAILIGSAFSVPIESSDSPQSLIPTTGTDGWYFRLMSVPMPLFVILVGLYTAIALWVVGSIALVSSVLTKHMLVPLVLVITWGISSLLLWARLLRQLPFGELLSLPYFITYAKHFSPHERIPVSLFAVVSLGMLGIILVVGTWRLQKSDV